MNFTLWEAWTIGFVICCLVSILFLAAVGVQIIQVKIGIPIEIAIIPTFLFFVGVLGLGIPKIVLKLVKPPRAFRQIAKENPEKE